MGAACTILEGNEEGPEGVKYFVIPDPKAVPMKEPNEKDANVPKSDLKSSLTSDPYTQYHSGMSSATNGSAASSVVSSAVSSAVSSVVSSAVSSAVSSDASDAKSSVESLVTGKQDAKRTVSLLGRIMEKEVIKQRTHLTSCQIKTSGSCSCGMKERYKSYSDGAKTEISKDQPSKESLEKQRKNEELTNSVWKKLEAKFAMFKISKEQVSRIIKQELEKKNSLKKEDTSEDENSKLLTSRRKEEIIRIQNLVSVSKPALEKGKETELKKDGDKLFDAGAEKTKRALEIERIAELVMKTKPGTNEESFTKKDDTSMESVGKRNELQSKKTDATIDSTKISKDSSTTTTIITAMTTTTAELETKTSGKEAQEAKMATSKSDKKSTSQTSKKSENIIEKEVSKESLTKEKQENVTKELKKLAETKEKSKSKDTKQKKEQKEEITVVVTKEKTKAESVKGSSSKSKSKSRSVSVTNSRKKRSRAKDESSEKKDTKKSDKSNNKKRDAKRKNSKVSQKAESSSKKANRKKNSDGSVTETTIVTTKKTEKDEVLGMLKDRESNLSEMFGSEKAKGAKMKKQIGDVAKTSGKPLKAVRPEAAYYQEVEKLGSDISEVVSADSDANDDGARTMKLVHKIKIMIKLRRKNAVNSEAYAPISLVVKEEELSKKDD